MRQRFAVDVVEADSATWKLLRLRLQYDDGHWIELEMLRSPAWLEQHLTEDRRHVWLDMPEMGVVGIARVGAIEPCPPIAEGPGRVVTSTFKHRLGTVYDLRVAGEEKAIGTTQTHPFWSVDREQWIPAVELRPGERLKTWTGFSTVESIEPRPEPEPVYNIEVEGDHVYRVGESGVLVHNASPNPYRTVLIQQNGAGYEYAEKAWQWRQSPARSVDVRENGSSNVGYLKYRVGNVVKYLMGPSSTLSGAGAATAYGSRHSEGQLMEQLETEASRTQGCIVIVEMFSERTPCNDCRNALRTTGGQFGRDESQFPLYYVVRRVVPSGRSSNERLMERYGQWFES